MRIIIYTIYKILHIIIIAYVNIEKMDAKSIPVVEDERGFHTRESLGDFWGLWHR